MITIKNLLDFTLYKQDNVQLLKNSVAYFKKIDKILFEVDNSTFELIVDNKDVYLKKETSEYIFILDSKKEHALLTLKQENISFDILIEYINIDIKDNIYTIEYKLESDEEKTRIEIKLNN